MRHSLAQLRDRAHRGDVVRLVERRQRSERFELEHDALVEDDGRREFRSTVHDTMSDAGELRAVELVVDPGKQLRQEVLMAKLLAVVPSRPGKIIPSGVSRAKMRFGADTLDLT